MIMKKSAYSITGLLLLGSFLAQAETLKEVSADSFSSNGPTAAGWHWLQQEGHKAKWTFTCNEEMGLRAVFCFSTLSTDRINGGAGYNSIIKVSINAPYRIKTVTLKNDCPHLKNLAAALGNSHGIGYPSHGCVTFVVKCDSRYPIVVEAFFKNRQTAVKKSSLKMLYVK